MFHVVRVSRPMHEIADNTLISKGLSRLCLPCWRPIECDAVSATPSCLSCSRDPGIRGVTRTKLVLERPPHVHLTRVANLPSRARFAFQPRGLRQLVAWQLKQDPSDSFSNDTHTHY
jgi:hypothetical protein